MPTILVVDDSAVDRALVGGLLSKEENWKVLFALNGEQAVASIEVNRPDLVVTDMIMPEMNGLKLVEEVNSKFPLVPIILMTSRGNEEIAVKALQVGAASYIPKNALSSNLVETVRHVLGVSVERKCQARLLECMTESVATFILENDYSLIPALVGYLQDDSVRIGLCDEADRVRVGVALDEALVNALYHGNLELSSDLRDNDHDQYAQLVQQRRDTSPYNERLIHIEARMSSEKATFTVRDEGPGFDHSGLPDPRNPANLENLGGRGVLLMRTFMDEVSFNSSGNEVTMVKWASNHQAPSDNGDSA